nr:amine sulfotransferase-like [Rhipicephalus microplus]
MYITHLMLRKGEPMTTHDDFSKEWRFLEYIEIKDWSSALPPRTIATHLMVKTMVTGEGKYIYVARNPWDVCVSFYHMLTNMSQFEFQDGKFEDFVDTFLNGDFGYGDYFEHVAWGYSLREQPNVFFVTYEELKRNLRDVVLKLAFFLGEQYGCALESNEPMLQELLERSNCDNMQPVVVVNFNGSANPHWDKVITQRKVTCKEGYEGDENRYAIVRKANAGDWREHFTPDLLQRMENRILEVEKQSPVMNLWNDIRAEAIKCIANSK